MTVTDSSHAWLAKLAEGRREELEETPEIEGRLPSRLSPGTL